MTDQIRAPWTPEQVAALNAFQRRGGVHPFTCGYEHPAHPNPILKATKNGWRCYVIGCDWEQDWAHAFMADPDAWPKFPFGERHGPTPEETRAAMLVQVGWYCWRCRAVNAQACRSDNVPVHVPAEWADEMRAEIARREDEDDGDEARTTPDNGAASRDTADGTLRERLATVIEAEASLARVVAALPPYSRPIHGDRSRGMQMGWDLARQAALDAIGQPAPTATEPASCPVDHCDPDQCGVHTPNGCGWQDPVLEQHATRAAATRDQAALTQIRLHIAAHRQRLKLADPVLLAKVDAVLREVGELEAAGGGPREQHARPAHPDGTPYRYHEIVAEGWDYCDGCQMWTTATQEQPHQCARTYIRGPLTAEPGDRP